MFECNACEGKYKKASDLKNHAKVCGGAKASTAGKVRCVCSKEYSKNYFKVHRKKCDAWKAANPDTEVTPPRAPRTACDACGKWMRRNNLARHLREACPGSEAGP